MRKGEENAFWIVVKVSGPAPGKRYGHTMSFLKPYLVVFGGHAGVEPINDVWALSIEKLPFTWEKITLSGEGPEARVYHTAAVCTVGLAAGMMVIFGGRGKDQNPRHDAWGLRRHRDGRWEWVQAPFKGAHTPADRYQVSQDFTRQSVALSGIH